MPNTIRIASAAMSLMVDGMIDMTMLIVNAGHLINGDAIVISGHKCTVDHIEFFDEPLMRIHVNTEQFGPMSVLCTDDALIETQYTERYTY